MNNNKDEKNIVLKKSSSFNNSIISGYESNYRNNKEINIDNKRDLLFKNNIFFSSSDLGNISYIIYKKEKNRKKINNENKFGGQILLRNNINFKIDINNSIQQVIKVNTRIGNEKTPKTQKKLLNNNSKRKINLNNKNKSKIYNTNSHSNIGQNKNIIKNIKYNISLTQKKFYINEKICFLRKKLKKIILFKIFMLIKKKCKSQNKKHKINEKINITNKKQSFDKIKSRLNLSSKKNIKSKNKDKKNNLFKQSIKSDNPFILFGNIGMIIPATQLLKKPANHNIDNLENFQQKKRNSNIKNQSSIFDSSKLKINKSQNKKDIKMIYNCNLNSKERNNLTKNNKKININSQKNINNKKYKEKKKRKNK